MQAAGLPMKEFPQTVANLTEIGSNLYNLIKGRGIVAYPDPAIRRALGHTVAVETSRGWRIAKDKVSHKIDVVVALAMAVHAAIEHSVVRELPIVVPIVAAGVPRSVPGGSMYAGGTVAAPWSGINPLPEAPPPAPSEPPAPAGRVYGPDGQFWDPPASNSPVVAKPGWLTKLQMAAANAAPPPADVFRQPCGAERKGGNAGFRFGGGSTWR
jgi:hypothetical protein